MTHVFPPGMKTDHLSRLVGLTKKTVCGDEVNLSPGQACIKAWRYSLPSSPTVNPRTRNMGVQCQPPFHEPHCSSQDASQRLCSAAVLRHDRRNGRITPASSDVGVLCLEPISLVLLSPQWPMAPLYWLGKGICFFRTPK